MLINILNRHDSLPQMSSVPMLKTLASECELDKLCCFLSLILSHMLNFGPLFKILGFTSS